MHVIAPSWPVLPTWRADAAAGRAVPEQAARPSKAPQVTLGFWVIKIAATTLGETGGDAVSMSLRLGYALSSVLFLAALVLAVSAQLRQRAFHPFLYWAVIVATTTAGTTMADFADRSLGIGYVGGSALLGLVLMLVLFAWYRSTGSISVASIRSVRVESFYWAAILASNTLGTALGDYLADSGLGYEGGALVFAAGLVVVALAWAFRLMPAAALFWAAFILTRPLGATLGDLLTKPHASGGLDLSRPLSTAAIGVFMVVCILVLPQRPASGAGH